MMDLPERTYWHGLWSVMNPDLPNPFDESTTIVYPDPDPSDARVVFALDPTVCIYCDRHVTTIYAPAVDDDEAWTAYATEHDPDCPWILSRNWTTSGAIATGNHRD